MNPTFAKLLIPTFILYIFYLQTLHRSPVPHLLFILLTPIYATLANHFIISNQQNLPTASLSPRYTSPMRHNTRLLFPFTLVFSLSVPSFLLFFAPSHPHPLYPLLIPHLVLMLSQILLETTAHIFFKFFTLYVRLGVTLAFVSYRIPVILQWYKAAVVWAEEEALKETPSFLPPVAQAAAVLNLVFWTFALLCYLLLYCLPAVCREPVFDDPEPSHLKNN